MDWIPEDIVSIDDERVRPFLDLRLQSANGKVLNSSFVVESPRLVELLLRSSYKILCLFMEDHHYSALSSLIQKRKGAGPIQFLRAEKELMNEVVGFKLHQGILALAERKPPVQLAELPRPIIALNGLANAENVGAIIRSAVAFGIRSFVVDRETADPFLRRAVRVSMGGAFAIDVAYVESLSTALGELKHAQALGNIIAVECGRNALSLSEVSLEGASVLIFGSEGAGIASDVLAVADRVIAIPMENTYVQSLNVGAAAAIVLSKCFVNKN